MDCTHESPAPEAREPAPARSWLAVLSTIVAVCTVAATFFASDDLWPFAPFRMFSHADNPNGVVKQLVIEGERADGRREEFEPYDFGLRRSELEEQTPWNAWIPEERFAAIIGVYNARNTRPIVHAQAIVTTIQLHNGEPVGVPTRSIIGDWASTDWTGPRAHQGDLPTAEGFPGYTG